MTSRPRAFLAVAVVALVFAAGGCVTHAAAAGHVAEADWNCLPGQVALEAENADKTDPEARSYAFVGCGHRGTVSCHDVGGVWTCGQPSDMQAKTPASLTPAAP
jgi:hypothetical protein